MAASTSTELSGKVLRCLKLDHTSLHFHLGLERVTLLKPTHHAVRKHKQLSKH